MPYQTLTQFQNVTGTEGLAAVFVYSATIVPIFIPLVLFALFIVTCLASYFIPKSTTGKGNFPASFAAAGYFIAIVAFTMNLVDGLINLQTLVICLVVAVIGTAWLLLSKE